MWNHSDSVSILICRIDIVMPVRIFRAANANSNISAYVRVNVTVNPVFANVCLFIYTEYSFRLIINVNNLRRTREQLTTLPKRILSR